MSKHPELVEMALEEIMAELLTSYGVSNSIINTGYYGHLTTEQIGIIGSKMRSIIQEIYWQFGYDVEDPNMSEEDKVREYWKNFDNYS